jgi:DNA ligase 1
MINLEMGTDEVVIKVEFINFYRFYIADQFLLDVATKSLKIGIDSKTLNKVWGDVIQKFQVMLAKKYEEHSHKVDNMIVTLKLDGMRCIFLKENGIITAYSREGKVINGLIEFENDFKELPDNTMYDGELIAKRLENEEVSDQFRRTIKLARTDGDKFGLEYYCFDWMPIEEFKSGKSKLKCFDRKGCLSSELNTKDYKLIKNLPFLYVGSDKDKIPELLAQVESQKLEGLMVNNTDSYYECKRSDALLKVKTMQTVDLLCTGLEKGEGRLSDVLGKIKVDYRGHEVLVGSGFSDNDRKYFIENQNEIVGRVVEISFFEESSNQDGGISLRFPVFKCVRDVGKEVSYN